MIIALIILIIVIMLLSAKKSKSENKVKKANPLTQPTNFLKEPKMSKEDFEALMKSNKLSEDDLLLTLAMEGKKFSTNVPYSNFQVGAAVLTEDGNVYIGANSELKYNDLLLTVHAEGSSVHHALLENPQSPVVKIAINEAPCGYCRQFLSELVTADRLQVITQTGTNLLSDLLPYKFGPSDLGMTTSLYKFPKYDLVVSSTSPDTATTTYKDQIAKALDVANMSYSPYTDSPMSTIVEFKDGSLYKGLYIENAAYNPTIGSITTALNQAFLYGKKIDDVARIFIALLPSKSLRKPTVPNFNPAVETIQINISKKST